MEFWDNNIPGIEKEKELRAPGYVIQFGLPPNRIDLMNTIDGIDFKEAWGSRKTESLTVNEKEIPVYFMGLEHLILNKSESGRDKDFDDLSYLKNL